MTHLMRRLRGALGIGVTWGVLWAVIGLVLGVIVTIQELSLGRVALWGLLGAAAIPLLTGADASVGFIIGPMDALFAATSVATARRGALRGAKPVDLLE